MMVISPNGIYKITVSYFLLIHRSYIESLVFTEIFLIVSFLSRAPCLCCLATCILYISGGTIVIADFVFGCA
ncbi:hypothetical protein F5Y04DRAFT_214355 [Hypomontagnella monticulosa]|nr:hypothetical protein F5Y04DRAFT_214355 [Hypomontagnella monticulosa]